MEDQKSVEDQKALDHQAWLKKMDENLEKLRNSDGSSTKYQVDHKQECLEGWGILKTLLGNPGAVIREIWESSFPPPTKSKAVTHNTPRSPSALVPAKEGSNSGRQKSGSNTCRVCTHAEKAPDGRTVFSYSFYSRSALDAISFDPFIVEADISHDAAMSQGIFGLMRLKREAWLEEHLTDATISKLQSRQRILEEQRRTTQAGQRLHQTIHTSNSQSHPSTPTQQSHPAVPTQQGRIVQPQPALPQQANRALPTPAPLRPNVSNDQIEAAAIRALLEGVRTNKDWEGYGEALKQHLPPYAVQEVKNRLSELLKLNPDGFA